MAPLLAAAFALVGSLADFTYFLGLFFKVIMYD